MFLHILENYACFDSVLASPRVEYMNQNIPIFIIYEETFAKYTDIQNVQHLFYSTCANELLERYNFEEILTKYTPPGDDVARTNFRPRVEMLTRWWQ